MDIKNEQVKATEDTGVKDRNQQTVLADNFEKSLRESGIKIVIPREDGK